MDYLVGNGQQMNALYLAPIFNLVEKYPPLSLLKGYVEKAKQTVTEISQKNLTRQSLVCATSEINFGTEYSSNLNDKEIRNLVPSYD